MDLVLPPDFKEFLNILRDSESCDTKLLYKRRMKASAFPVPAYRVVGREATRCRRRLRTSRMPEPGLRAPRFGIPRVFIQFLPRSIGPPAPRLIILCGALSPSRMPYPLRAARCDSLRSGRAWLSAVATRAGSARWRVTRVPPGRGPAAADRGAR